MKLQQSTFLWETMLIEESKVLSLYAFFFAIKLSIPKGSFCWGEIMRQAVSTEYMAFMMNVRENMTFRYGSSLLFVLIGCLYQLLFRRRYFVCMEVFHRILWQQMTLWIYKDQRTFPTKACSVTCFGQIQTKISKTGEKTIEE